VGIQEAKKFRISDLHKTHPPLTSINDAEGVRAWCADGRRIYPSSPGSLS